jgi:hypothetical protein
MERVRPSSSSSPSSQSRVRGRPFEPGNAGRPPGSKNKTTRLIEELFDGEAEKLTRKLLDCALGGDVRCLLYCVDRASPKGRGRPLGLQLPPIKSVCDVPAAMSAIALGVTNGDVTVEEGSHLVQILDRYSNAVAAREFAIRLQNLEGQVNMLNTLKRRGT